MSERMGPSNPSKAAVDSERNVGWEQDGRLYRLVADSAQDFIFVIDQQDVVRYVNPAAAEAFHMPVDRLVGSRRTGLFGGPEAHRQHDDLERVLRTGEPLHVEHQATFVNRTVWLDTWLTPIRDQRGGVEMVLGVSRDITQRKIAEETLQEHRALDEVIARISRLFINLSGNEIDRGILDALERLGTAIHVDLCRVYLLSEDGKTDLGLYEWDTGAKVASFQPDRRSTEGFWLAERLRHERCLMVHSAVDVPSWAAAERDYLSHRNIRSYIAVPLFRSGTLTGVFSVATCGREVRWPDYFESLMPVVGEVLASALARKRAEETISRMAAELLKAQKLESIGILAGGIAHDFNNILSAIWGNVSMARIRSASGGLAVGHLLEAEKALGRARDLTQQLLTFSKGGAPVKRLAALPQLVRESAEFATRGSNVRCEFSFPEDLWNAEVDDGQISQVFQNLVINAVQAMPKGGVIRVTAGNVAPPDNLPSTLLPARYVRVAIADQGSGILPEHLPKMFVPYFTTKPAGNGLGLATSYSIVRKHDGLMTVSSVAGKGAVFAVYLPASPSPVHPTESWQARDYRGRGRVLLVDDEEPIRRSSSAMLEDLGYRVETAADGAEAVERYRRARRQGASFDVVILDLTIRGGIGGRETIVRLQEEDPDVIAVASSGYSTDPIMSDFEQHGFRGILRKPYGIEQLGAALQRLLPTPEPSDSEP